MRTQKELIEEANRIARGEVAKPVQRKPVPPKVAPAPVVEEKPAPVKRRGRSRKANGTATAAG